MKDQSEIQMLSSMLTALKETSSRLDKEAILKRYVKEYPVIEGYLHACYDPFRQYYLTSKTAMRASPEPMELEDHMSLLKVLQSLEDKECTGGAAATLWASHVSVLPEHLQEVANQILDKNFKVRIGIPTLNKVLTEPIYQFKVALGQSYSNKLAKWEDGATWYASRKLDGIRCVAVITEEGVQLFSRQGKAFTTLRVLEGELKRSPQSVVLDGELALPTKDGSDDFQGLMKQIRRKNHQIYDVRFHVFDILTLKELSTGKSKRSFQGRQRQLKVFIERMNSHMLCRVKQKKVDEEGFKEAKKKAAQKGWEGLILRRNASYKGKRSNDILKYKLFKDDEFEVKRIEVGSMTLLENGKQITAKVMKAAIIEHRGHEVHVGSGWSVPQRRQFRKNPDLLVGKLITVQYFEETENQKKGKSLRFPTFKALHGSERTT